MSFNFKRYFAILFLIMVSCDNRLAINENILLIVEDFNAAKDSVVTIKLVNKSDRNYYITMDKSRMYNYSGFDYALNSSVILKPIIYSEGKQIPLRGERFVNKSAFPRKDKCIEDEVFQSNKFYKDYITLKNAIFLKGKSSKILMIPFSLKFKTCFSSFHYDLTTGKENELVLEYKMSQQQLEKDVDVARRDSLMKKGYYPYYQPIVSNKASLVFE